MCLSEIGSIAYVEWLKTLSLRPDMNLTLHAHIVMPDHMHAVLSIGANPYNGGGMGDGAGRDDTHDGTGDGQDRDLGKDALQCVSTQIPVPSQIQVPSPTPIPSDVSIPSDAPPSIPIPSMTSGTYGPQRKNLSSIMRGYKSTVTLQSRKINPHFGWQTRFYDIIIRDQRALDNVVRYIEQNPIAWSKKHENDPL